jgi:ubiquinone biosynthesis protein COQ9
LAPHKEAARRASAFLALPQNAALAAKLLFRSVDAMWRAAGDKTSDFNYYTKRALLAGVYGSTLLYWLSDASEGSAETWTFLDHRIGNVMAIQKARGEMERAVAKLPDPFGILAALRPPKPK